MREGDDVTKPQQPELRRTGYGATDQESAERRAGQGPRDEGGNTGPVPEENKPGHRPDDEQDKPDR